MVMIEIGSHRFVFDRIGIGVALVYHADVEGVVEAFLLYQRALEIVQTDLTEGTDEQTQQTELGGRTGVGKDLVEKKHAGLLHTVVVAVDDVPDAVARRLKAGHGDIAVDIEAHAQKAVDEPDVATTAVGMGGIQWKRTELASLQIGIFEQTIAHFATEIGVKSFAHHGYLSVSFVKTWVNLRKITLSEKVFIVFL